MLRLDLGLSCHESPSPRAHFVTAWGYSYVGRQQLFLGGSLQESLVSHPGEFKSKLQAENSTWRNDAVTQCPIGNCTFTVRCDKCGKENSYRASDVLKFEMEPPESFTPHPLFAEGGIGSPDIVEHRTSQE
jgi:hypothetical protein